MNLAKQLREAAHRAPADLQPAHAKALTIRQDYFPENKTRLLDVYTPTWRELNQDPAFRSLFRPVSGT